MPIKHFPLWFKWFILQSKLSINILTTLFPVMNPECAANLEELDKTIEHFLREEQWDQISVKDIMNRLAKMYGEDIKKYRKYVKDKVDVTMPRMVKQYLESMNIGNLHHDGMSLSEAVDIANERLPPKKTH